MSKTRWAVLLIVFTAMAIVSWAQKPATLPGRVPMDNVLLQPDAEWNTYYDVVPEGERKLYYTVGKALLPAVREQIANIKDLDQRVKALENKTKPQEPNKVKP